MPFPMTHLHIAYNILKNRNEINNACDFMLGAVAPDSVHFRSDYNTKLKIKSHLCAKDEKWGDITDNDKWLKEVLLFLEENKDASNIDFIYGYCTHVITDIRNNIKVWIPYKKQIAQQNGNNGHTYHEEAYAIDYKLYLHSNQEYIWELLDKAKGYDINDKVYGKDIDVMKESILNEQFENRVLMDLSKNNYITLPEITRFISDESVYISELLFKDY